MAYTQKMMASFNEDTDFANTFKLMRKFDGTIITTQHPDDFQSIYVIGTCETVLYQFYQYALCDRAILPYGTKPNIKAHGIKPFERVSNVCGLIVELCETEDLTITIHT